MGLHWGGVTIPPEPLRPPLVRSIPQLTCRRPNRATLSLEHSDLFRSPCWTCGVLSVSSLMSKGSELVSLSCNFCTSLDDVCLASVLALRPYVRRLQRLALPHATSTRPADVVCQCSYGVTRALAERIPQSVTDTW